MKPNLTAAELVEIALRTRVPGGAEVWNFLPQKDAFTPHETARNVMRCAVEAILSALRAQEAGREGERFRHKTRGTEYTVIGEAQLQMSADMLVDGSEMVVYRGDDGRLWVREYSEFHDGRFTAISDRHPHGGRGDRVAGAGGG